MSAAHTPGPWKAHATGLSRSGLPEYQIHWTDIGECVAEIVHGEENAALIAAAPDLLEAMQNLENDAGQMPVSAWEMVQQAVFKATGARKP